MKFSHSLLSYSIALTSSQRATIPKTEMFPQSTINYSKHFKLWASLAAFILLTSSVKASGCDSPIYCEGPILKTVELASLYPDSKTFVDKPTTKPVKEVIAAFSLLGPNPTPKAIKAFVNNNFGPEGQELVPVKLTNFNSNPKFLQKIAEPVLRGFGIALHNFWPELTRKVDTSFLCDGCVSSILPAKRSFVVPGGRFREIYYWDSFFVLEGLLVSELTEISSNMILNFVDYVNEYGFMPNGARIYYLNRSQPPLLIQMAKIHYEKTRDIKYIQKILPSLEAEHNFWINNRTVQVDDNNSLSRYYVYNSHPRPESYREDYHLVETTKFSSKKKAGIYADIAAAAESGWDFSSRWASQPKLTNSTELLRTLITRDILPLDLNSILYLNEITMSDFYSLLKNKRKSLSYKKMANKRAEAMVNLLYNAKKKGFFDMNLKDKKLNKNFYSSAFWPFWALKSSGKLPKDRSLLLHPAKMISDLLDKYPGGIPTSFIKSEQQWDFPNSWPPVQYVALRALISTWEILADCDYNDVDKSTDKDLEFIRKTIHRLAQNYIDNTFCGWYQTGGSIPNILSKIPGTKDSGHMFEKYDANVLGSSGSGGEYTVQDGFGWTNGIALWILDKWGSVLKEPTCGSNKN